VSEIRSTYNSGLFFNTGAGSSEFRTGPRRPDLQFELPPRSVTSMGMAETTYS
jgi:hypothetical protein